MKCIFLNPTENIFVKVRSFLPFSDTLCKLCSKNVVFAIWSPGQGAWSFDSIVRTFPIKLRYYRLRSDDFEEFFLHKNFNNRANFGQLNELVKLDVNKSEWGAQICLKDAQTEKVDSVLLHGNFLLRSDAFLKVILRRKFNSELVLANLTQVVVTYVLCFCIRGTETSKVWAGWKKSFCSIGHWISVVVKFFFGVFCEKKLKTELNFSIWTLSLSHYK